MAANKWFIFRFADVEVRERNYSIAKAGQVLPVEPKVFRLLLYLLHNSRRVIGKEELLNAVWGDAAVTENSLTRSLFKLRRLLDDDAREPRYIETVSTVGYRMICSVEVLEDAAGNPEPAVTRDGFDAGNPAAVSFNGGHEVAVSDSSSRADSGFGGEAVRAPASGERARPVWFQWVAVAAAFAASLAFLIWHLRQPLPPLRILAYTQLTNSGLAKYAVGTDGTRVYLNTVEPAGIGQVMVSGGQVAPIPVDLPDDGEAASDYPEVWDVSPDGSSLLVGAGGDTAGNSTHEISVVGTLGRPVRLLTKAVSAAWSPDGESVLYSTAHGDIFVIPSEGGKPRLVLSSSAPPGEVQVVSNLRMSPDGRAIRFDMAHTIWEVPVGGSKAHELLPGWRTSSWKCCGRWTPDGKIFLFTLVERPGYRFSGQQIWAVDERRGDLGAPIARPIQLTSGPIVWALPFPSRDGKSIFASGFTFRGELVRYDRESNQFRPYLEGISAEFVAFSSDKRYVAYVSFPDGILWRANRDGSGQVQLTRPPFYPKNPRWSPDGTQILFTDLSPGDVDAIYVVSSQGGTPTQVLPEDHEPQEDGNWSPDGKEVVCSWNADFEGVHPAGRREIRVLDLAGHTVSTVPGSRDMWSPRWSPDGRFIAALTHPAQALKVFDVQLGQWTKVADGANFPTFSADSRSIYFIGSEGGHGVFRVPTTGGKAVRIADLDGFRTTGWYGFWMGLDPDGSPLLLRDAGNDEIYSLSLDRK